MQKFFTTLAVLFIFSNAFAFSDIGSNNLHKNAIEYLSRHSVVSGFSDGEFKPQQWITRAELSKIIVGARGESPSPREFNSCFGDVASEWFARFVCFAQNENWISGYPDGTFRPSAEVNYAEAAKIIINALGGGLDDSTKFSNVADDEWFAIFANTIRARNLSDDSTFFADQKITRGEVAEIIFRELVVKNSTESKFGSELVEDFDFEISPDVIVAQSIDFSNSKNSGLMLSGWQFINGNWVTKPTLEFNGRDYSFTTPEEYVVALIAIQKNFSALGVNIFTDDITRFISEFRTFFGYYPKTIPDPAIVPENENFFGENSSVSVAANFTDLDFTDESVVAARGGAVVKTGGALIYIGYEVCPPLNKNPVLASFTDGRLNWVRRNYETSLDESVGYGLLTDGKNLFAVFTSRGIEESIGLDFRRFAKRGWLDEYGEGEGKQIAVIAKINLENGVYWATPLGWSHAEYILMRTEK